MKTPVKKNPEYRPRLIPEKTRIDYLIDALSIILLTGLWVYCFMAYSGMPETVPTHFDLKGNVDGFGSRLSVFLMPAIATILFVGMYVLNRYPHIFNYPVKLTPENAASQYQLATRFIRWMNLGLVILLGAISFMITLGSQGGKLNPWFLPGILIFSVLSVFPVIIYMVAAGKKARKPKNG